MNPNRLWWIRGGVLLALVLTLWLAGPRAYAVAAARFGHRGGVAIEVQRAGFVQVPEWLRGELLTAALTDLAPRLHGRVAMLEDQQALELRDRVQASAWVAAASLERQFPDQLRLRMQMRRPVLSVWRKRRDAEVCEALVDEAGICLPPTTLELPRTMAQAGPPLIFGKPHPDPRVRAAAAVAREWREEMAPLAPAAPPLVEVDASNLGYQWIADERWSEIRVGLRRVDGQVVYFDYDHPPGSAAPRVPMAEKAKVLEQILHLHPGLAGLRFGDLRMVKRWRDWLRTE